MAQARDATAPGPDGSPPFVKVLEIPNDLRAEEDLADSLLPIANPSDTSSRYLEFLAEIRRHLSENCPVLVRGWRTPNPCRLTRGGIELLRGSVDQLVEWQGNLLLLIL